MRVNSMNTGERRKYDRRGKSVIMRALELTCIGVLSIEMGLIKEHRIDVYAEIIGLRPRAPIEKDSWLEIITNRISGILKEYDKAYVLCKFFSTRPMPKDLWGILFETIILIDLKIPYTTTRNTIPIVILPRISEEHIRFLPEQVGIRISNTKRETKYLLIVDIAGINILFIEYEKLPDNTTNAILKMLSPKKRNGNQICERSH